MRTAEEYGARRDLMMKVLDETGFAASEPQGAYYVMADCSHLGLGNDVAVAKHLVENVGVAVVPGSSFFTRPEDGAHLVRFAFPKRLETLEAAGERLLTRGR
jgi:L-glutamine---4-(methylsulfanyl)-2-oxobutanoate aminotransferase